MKEQITQNITVEEDEMIITPDEAEKEKLHIELFINGKPFNDHLRVLVIDKYYGLKEGGLSDKQAADPLILPEEPAEVITPKPFTDKG